MYNIGMVLSIFNSTICLSHYSVEEYKPIAQRPFIIHVFGHTLIFTAAFPIITFCQSFIISNQFSGVYSQMLRIEISFLFWDT